MYLLLDKFSNVSRDDVSDLYTRMVLITSDVYSSTILTDSINIRFRPSQTCVMVNTETYQEQTFSYEEFLNLLGSNQVVNAVMYYTCVYLFDITLRDWLIGKSIDFLSVKQVAEKPTKYTLNYLDGFLWRLVSAGKKSIDKDINNIQTLVYRYNKYLHIDNILIFVPQLIAECMKERCSVVQLDGDWIRVNGITHEYIFKIIDRALFTRALML